MLNIVLYQPQIPPNTGNVIRLCANSGSVLHLIRPLGFRLTNKSFKRAGLDYHDLMTLKVHDNLTNCLLSIGDCRSFTITKFGQKPYNAPKYRSGDVLIFGSEIDGLPSDVLQSVGKDKTLYIPMKKGSRSLNLSNAVAIVLYEAWRQIGFPPSRNIF
ncbi:MAG: tRNA (uridine(34)/cytosine(34)/5-carboxymethylaminomethyluridine(34)-2'-O)-methyltransferase TrmL [Proteobacteria bacterium]|nr:tRNA (uridine(34)/cytosine(34)/5-carboxymethylaminomethyluridine(34)-2'-O)-methyltransferase TrmL [Pseudomonadota bacterium]